VSFTHDRPGASAVVLPYARPHRAVSTGMTAGPVLRGAMALVML